MASQKSRTPSHAAAALRFWKGLARGENRFLGQKNPVAGVAGLATVLGGCDRRFARSGASQALELRLVLDGGGTTRTEGRR